MIELNFGVKIETVENITVIRNDLADTEYIPR